MKQLAVWAAGIFVVGFALPEATWPVKEPSNALPDTRLAEAPEAIYSKNPNDSWNWIFYYLFPRRVDQRNRP